MFFQRLGQYLIALSQQASFILGSIAFKLPVFIPYFFPSVQPFVGLLASPVVKQWLSPVGFYGFLFLAAFLAWKKERDLREQQSPEVLQNRVTQLELELEYSKPRTLTSQQRRVLVDRLRSAFRDHQRHRIRCPA
jgi:hypothetical protein